MRIPAAIDPQLAVPPRLGRPATRRPVTPTARLMAAHGKLDRLLLRADDADLVQAWVDYQVALTLTFNQQTLIARHLLVAGLSPQERAAL